MKNTTSLLSGAFNYVRNLPVKNQLALFGALTLILTLGLSVTKLAKGLSMVSEDSMFFLIIYAIVIDFGMLFFKCGILYATFHKVQEIKPWAYVGLIAFALMSAGFNSWSLVGTKEVFSFHWFMAVVLGCSVPFATFLFGECIGGVLKDKRPPSAEEMRLLKVLRTLEDMDGDKKKAASELDITYRHLNRQLEQARERGLSPAGFN